MSSISIALAPLYNVATSFLRFSSTRIIYIISNTNEQKTVCCCWVVLFKEENYNLGVCDWLRSVLRYMYIVNVWISTSKQERWDDDKHERSTFGSSLFVFLQSNQTNVMTTLAVMNCKVGCNFRCGQNRNIKFQ